MGGPPWEITTCDWLCFATLAVEKVAAVCEATEFDWLCCSAAAEGDEVAV